MLSEFGDNNPCWKELKHVFQSHLIFMWRRHCKSNPADQPGFLIYWLQVLRKSRSQTFIDCYKNILKKAELTAYICHIRSCLFNKLISNFLSHLLFIWRTFSRQVTVRWPRGWAKNQVCVNENSRNNWHQIVTRTDTHFQNLDHQLLQFLSPKCCYGFLTHFMSLVFLYTPWKH